MTLSWKYILFCMHVTHLSHTDKVVVRKLSHLPGKEQVFALLHGLAFVIILRLEQA